MKINGSLARGETWPNSHAILYTHTVPSTTFGMKTFFSSWFGSILYIIRFIIVQHVVEVHSFRLWVIFVHFGFTMWKVQLFLCITLFIHMPISGHHDVWNIFMSFKWKSCLIAYFFACYDCLKSVDLQFLLVLWAGCFISAAYEAQIILDWDQVNDLASEEFVSSLQYVFFSHQL